MIRSLFKLGLILVVAVVGYNFFFGTAEEKEQSREIVGKVRDLGKDAWGLLKSEKQKLDDGKYEGAVDKVGSAVKSVGGLLGRLKNTAEDLHDSGALDRINELQAKQEELQRSLASETPESYDADREAEVQKELETLLKQTENLMKSMEQE